MTSPIRLTALDDSGRPTTVKWEWVDGRDATAEIRMMLAEAGEIEMAGALDSVTVARDALIVFWDIAWSRAFGPIPDPVNKAVALYRQKVFSDSVEPETRGRLVESRPSATRPIVDTEDL